MRILLVESMEQERHTLAPLSASLGVPELDESLQKKNSDHE